MKAVSIIFFLLIAFINVSLAHQIELQGSISSTGKILEASLDSNVVYAIVTAGVLGIVKIEKKIRI